VESLDERVAYLERRMEVHTALVADLRVDVRGIRAGLGQLRSDLRTETGQLRTEMGQLRAEMGQLRGEMGGLRSELRTDMRGLRSEMCADMSELRSDVRRLDQKMDRHFMWLVGVLVGVLLALVGLALQIARSQPL